MATPTHRLTVAQADDWLARFEATPDGERGNCEHGHIGDSDHPGGRCMNEVWLASSEGIAEAHMHAAKAGLEGITL